MNKFDKYLTYSSVGMWGFFFFSIIMAWNFEDNIPFMNTLVIINILFVMNWCISRVLAIYGFSKYFFPKTSFVRVIFNLFLIRQSIKFFKKLFS